MKTLLGIGLAILVSVSPASAAVNIINSPLVSIAQGTQTFGPFDIPDNIEQFTLTLARCTSVNLTTWADASTAINIKLFVSTDGGNSYQEWSGFGSVGGILSIGGQEFPTSGLTRQLPVGTGRKGELVLTVTNGPLVTTLLLRVQ